MCKSDVPITRHHVDMIGELPTSSHSCSLTRTSRWIHHSNKDQLGDPPKRLSPRERERGGNKWKDRALSHRFLLQSSVERSRSEPSSFTAFCCEYIPALRAHTHTCTHRTHTHANRRNTCTRTRTRTHAHTTHTHTYERRGPPFCHLQVQDSLHAFINTDAIRLLCTSVARNLARASSDLLQR